jgi:hypothetical protein
VLPHAAKLASTNLTHHNIPLPGYVVVSTQIVPEHVQPFPDVETEIAPRRDAAVDRENPMLETALRHARAGLRVFPVCSRSKKPRWVDWPNRATCDPGEIRAWWTLHPDDDVALLTGNGLLALDADKGGMWSLVALTRPRKHGELPRTPIQRTGSGGYRYLLRTTRRCR